MDLNLTEKTAVVTGGNGGIGLAIAEVLAQGGARVVVGARTRTVELADLQRRHDVRFVAVDLAAPGGADHLITEAAGPAGGLDIVVNNVGGSEPAPSSIDFDDGQWQRIFDVTLFSAVRTVRAAVPHLRGRPGAAIVTIGSVNAKVPSGPIAPYCAAKAALSNVSKAWAEELAPEGIRVNTISPGPVRTPMWTGTGGFAHGIAAQAQTTVADVMDRVLPAQMAISTGRISEPEEIAALVAFLASDRAANITGSDYLVDGGMVKTVA